MAATVANMAITQAVQATTLTKTLWRSGIWGLAGTCALWSVVRALGLEGDGALVLVVAFTPYAAAGSVLVLAAALLLRVWWAAGVAALAAVVLLAGVLPRWVPDGDGQDADGPRLRVLTSNMLVGGADARTIVDLVRRHRVDLLAVQEFTPDAEGALDAAGLARLLPNRVSYPSPGVEGSALFSRYPLRDDGLRTHPSGFTQARATVSVPGAAAIAVESAHPCAPATPAMAACWHKDLAGEPAASPHGPVRVLAGDFNAALDHAGLRRLIGSGYRDAGAARGQGLTPTWPYDEKWWVPGVTIDHILADRRVGVTGYGVHRVPRSDHRAVFAELRLPASPS
jgi:endonuclease/exonuclease/phosphatase family metal-dependent hydrolase